MTFTRGNMLSVRSSVHQSVSAFYLTPYCCVYFRLACFVYQISDHMTRSSVLLAPADKPISFPEANACPVPGYHIYQSQILYHKTNYCYEKFNVISDAVKTYAHFNQILKSYRVSVIVFYLYLCLFVKFFKVWKTV